jgi:hypothetical protein
MRDADELSRLRGNRQFPSVSLSWIKCPRANAAYVGFNIVVSHKECHMPRLQILQGGCEFSASVVILPDNRCITQARADDRMPRQGMQEISYSIIPTRQISDARSLARSLKIPADLARFAETNGCEFPFAKGRRKTDIRATAAAQGQREEAVWASLAADRSSQMSLPHRSSDARSRL